MALSVSCCPNTYSNTLSLIHGVGDYVAADRKFIEMRRRALKRFLNLTVRHPILTEDDIVKYFLTFNGSVSTGDQCGEQCVGSICGCQCGDQCGEQYVDVNVGSNVWDQYVDVNVWSYVGSKVGINMGINVGSNVGINVGSCVGSMWAAVWRSLCRSMVRQIENRKFYYLNHHLYVYSTYISILVRDIVKLYISPQH